MARVLGALSIFLFSAAPAHADQFLKGTPHISSQEVEQQLHAQLRNMLGQGDDASNARLEDLQSRLKPLFSAMPKSADGWLTHGTARYVLHRFFAQEHGWHVRGLEASGTDAWNGDASSISMLQDRIPSFVLQLFEQYRSDGLGLRELAVLAATLEDLVHSEAMQLLLSVFAVQETPTNTRLSFVDATRILRTYLLFFTMPNPEYADLSLDELNSVLGQASTIWKAWPDMIAWMHDLRYAIIQDTTPLKNPFKRTFDGFDINTLIAWVERLGENYGSFQNLECYGMRHALIDLSDGSGRVRLSSFYKAAFENKTSHFNESPDYLRHLGVLDETDPRHPSVILTNYVYSRTNCVASSSLYSVCCLDECDHLMAKLERIIGNPTASPEMVALFVAALPSDTVPAPRELSVVLRRRLNEIAGRHGGSIPLHGRLFAQWMHHAYPNECAWPHVTGSLDSPIFPLDWMLREGETGLLLRASNEDMQSFMDAAAAMNASEHLQDSLIPWSDEEELRVGAPRSRGRLMFWLRCAAMIVIILSIVVALLSAPGFSSNASPTKSTKGVSWNFTTGNARKAEVVLV